MKIKYELNNAHVCQDNAPYVLIKNMTNKVVLGMPFMASLYPFLIEHNGITTYPFRHKVTFKFISKVEIDTNNCLNTLIFTKTKHLNFLK